MGDTRNWPAFGLVAMLMGCGTDFTIQFGLYAIIVIGIVKATMDVSHGLDRAFAFILIFSVTFCPYSLCAPPCVLSLWRAKTYLCTYCTPITRDVPRPCGFGPIFWLSQMFLGSSATGSYR